jgi:hypothetical protein
MAKRQTTQPYLDHDTLTQKQQARHLGVKEETVLNLGHPVPVSRLAENPAGRVVDYANNQVSKDIVRGPPRSVGVYGRFTDPKSGISSQSNIDAWSGRASENSYHGSDPRGRGAGGDGHLLSTKGWANLPDSGAESGPGRIEKAKRY